jgi:5S rRNA maturation endonuclease (ribonuclease M5)
MTKKEKGQEQVINVEGRDVKFNIEDLSDESKAQYARANQLASEIVQLEQVLSEKRFIVNNYVSFVVNELEPKKSDSDDKS